jgi:hypothetical protein
MIITVKYITQDGVEHTKVEAAVDHGTALDILQRHDIAVTDEHIAGIVHELRERDAVLEVLRQHASAFTPVEDATAPVSP